jgi:addiction module HigA family antidote
MTQKVRSANKAKAMRTVQPVSPGEMLEEEFLKPLGLTKYRLAKDIGVPAQRIGEIVPGKRPVTADTDLRLCRYFGLSDGGWLRGQAAYDTAFAKQALRKELATIQRCSLLQQTPDSELKLARKRPKEVQHG